MSIEEKFIQTIDTCQRARYPYIWLVSQEETRSLEMIAKAAASGKLQCYVWDDIVLWKRINSWLVESQTDYSRLPEILNAQGLLQSFQNLLAIYPP